MKIAVIGSQKTIEHSLSLIDQEAIFVQCLPFMCVSKDAGKCVKNCQKDVDAILFTGYLPFCSASREVVPTVPWEYMYRSVSALFAALLRESLTKHIEIRRISSDLRDNLGDSVGQSLYTEVGLLSDQLEIHRYPHDALAEGALEQMAQFHCDNCRAGKVDICLTGIDEVYNSVSEQGYPIAMVRPTMEVVLQQIEKLRLRNQLRLQRGNQVAVVALQVFFQREGAFVAQNDEYNEFLLFKTIQEQILIFARQIDAAVELRENGRSFIYTTQSIIERESHSFSQFQLINRLSAFPGIRNVALGIGLSETHREAKANAELACLTAEKKRNSCFYIVYEDRRLAGPFHVKKEKTDAEFLPRLKIISRRTSVGMNTLQTLRRVMKQYSIDVTTLPELARLCGMTNSNMNRIAAKLETGGCIKNVGSQPLPGAGRPRRLIKINLD